MPPSKMTDWNAPEARRSGMNVVVKVAPYLWPDDKPWVKRRVVVALLMLLVAKLIAVGTPFFYKAAVDSLSGDTDNAAVWLAIGAVGLTVAYGMARLMNWMIRTTRSPRSTFAAWPP